MSNAFVTIKMCYVYNQWYDISCATLYIIFEIMRHLHVTHCCLILGPATVGQYLDLQTSSSERA